MMSQIFEIHPQILYQWIIDKQVVLIDVREPQELLTTSIIGAVNIPLAFLLTEIDKIEIPLDAKVVLICAAGVRSMLGCQRLSNAGFPHNLYNLSGGIYQWQSVGLPV